MNKKTVQVVLAAAIVTGFALWHDSAEGQGSKGSAPIPADLAYLPTRSLGVVTVRTADLWNSELGKSIRTKLGKELDQVTREMVKGIGLPLSEIERFTVVIPSPDRPAELVLIKASKPLDAKAFAKKRIPAGEWKKHADRDYFGDDFRAVTFLDATTFATGLTGDIQNLLDTVKEKGKSNLGKARALLAGKHAVVVAVDPSVLEAVADQVPPQLEGLKAILKANLATMTVDLGDKLTVRVHSTFPGEGDARQGLKAAELGRKMLLDLLTSGVKQLDRDASAAPIVSMLKDLERSLKVAKLTPKGTTLSAVVEMKIKEDALGLVAADAVSRSRAAAARMESQNHLKQIGLAMHNYLSATGSFPPIAIYSKDGKPLLSWRVLLLPYLEQDALYREFRLDEAWDSDHNKKLLDKLPRVFVSPTGKPKNKYGTYYRVFHGKSAAFEGKAGLNIANFTDGTSNTILAVEAASDVPWTKPEELPFDAAKELPKLTGLHKDGFLALFADGSVRFIKESINKDTLKALVTRNGGEVVAGCQ